MTVSRAELLQKRDALFCGEFYPDYLFELFCTLCEILSDEKLKEQQWEYCLEKEVEGLDIGELQLNREVYADFLKRSLYRYLTGVAAFFYRQEVDWFRKLTYQVKNKLSLLNRNHLTTLGQAFNADNMSFNTSNENVQKILNAMNLTKAEMAVLHISIIKRLIAPVQYKKVPLGKHKMRLTKFIYDGMLKTEPSFLNIDKKFLNGCLLDFKPTIFETKDFVKERW